MQVLLLLLLLLLLLVLLLDSVEEEEGVEEGVGVEEEEGEVDQGEEEEEQQEEEEEQVEQVHLRIHPLPHHPLSPPLQPHSLPLSLQTVWTRDPAGGSPPIKICWIPGSFFTLALISTSLGVPRERE